MTVELKRLTEAAFNAGRDAINDECRDLIIENLSGQRPKGLLVITFDSHGAFRICAEGVMVHEAIGILQRCCYTLHDYIGAVLP